MITMKIERVIFRKFGVKSSFSSIRSICSISLPASEGKLLTNQKYLNHESHWRIPSHDQGGVSYFSKRHFTQKLVGTGAIQNEAMAIAMKKRPIRKGKRSTPDHEGTQQPGFWKVRAFATAEEYHLENLVEGLKKQDLYIPKKINTSGKSLPDVVHVVPKYELDHEAKEIYLFREGTVVMWNIPELESGNLIQFIKSYEDSSYSTAMVQSESEMMSYTYTNSGKRSHLKDGDIYLTPDSHLDKYTFSNAISQSVKLGIWEASLEHYIDSIEFVTEDLKAGRKIKMTREEVLRKQGELFALRHHINLSSDLLDTPDFYWENDELENLYQQTCGYFSISKRTRVMNEKINHCVELVELLSSHLSDRHHVRLEWMIIILIMVEVGFEMVHYLDRYLEEQEDNGKLTVPNNILG